MQLYRLNGPLLGLWMLILSFYSPLLLAHNILLKAHSRECFNEALHKGDKMAVTFQVGDREFGGSGNLAIDFWVSTLLFSHTLFSWIRYYK